jgi:hypothetical protein
LRPLAFRIYDFKSISDSGLCTFSQDGITVLAGQNESGKTSILTALRVRERNRGVILPVGLVEFVDGGRTVALEPLNRDLGKASVGERRHGLHRSHLFLVMAPPFRIIGTSNLLWGLPQRVCVLLGWLSLARSLRKAPPWPLASGSGGLTEQAFQPQTKGSSPS